MFQRLILQFPLPREVAPVTSRAEARGRRSIFHRAACQRLDLSFSFDIMFCLAREVCI